MSLFSSLGYIANLTCFGLLAVDSALTAVHAHIAYMMIDIPLAPILSRAGRWPPKNGQSSARRVSSRDVTSRARMCCLWTIAKKNRRLIIAKKDHSMIKKFLKQKEDWRLKTIGSFTF